MKYELSEGDYLKHPLIEDTEVYVHGDCLTRVDTGEFVTAVRIGKHAVSVIHPTREAPDDRKEEKLPKSMLRRELKINREKILSIATLRNIARDKYDKSMEKGEPDEITGEEIVEMMSKMLSWYNFYLLGHHPEVEGRVISEDEDGYELGVRVVKE